MTFEPHIGRIANVVDRTIVMASASNAMRVRVGDHLGFDRDDRRLRQECSVERVDGRTGVIHGKGSFPGIREGDVLRLLERSDKTQPRSTDNPLAIRLDNSYTGAPIHEMLFDAALEIRQADKPWPQTAHVSTRDFFNFVKQTSARVEMGTETQFVDVTTPGGRFVLISDSSVDDDDLVFGYESFDIIRAQSTYELCERTASALMERMAELKRLLETKGHL